MWLVVEAANSTSIATPRDELCAPIDISFYGRKHHNRHTPNVVGAEHQALHPFSTRQISKPNFMLVFSNILAIWNILLNMLFIRPRAREVSFVQFGKIARGKIARSDQTFEVVI